MYSVVYCILHCVYVHDYIYSCMVSLILVLIVTFGCISPQPLILKRLDYHRVGRLHIKVGMAQTLP